jgi:hypothetical protein
VVLINNEQIITKSDSDVIKLTTHRIRYQDDQTLTSIMLDQVSGIDIQYTSKPLLIFIGLVFGASGIYFMINETDGTVGVLLFVAAAIALFMFLGSRKHVVAIGSSSSKIIFHTKGMNQKAVHDFVNKVEEARFNYSRL